MDGAVRRLGLLRCRAGLAGRARHRAGSARTPRRRRRHHHRRRHRSLRDDYRQPRHSPGDHWPLLGGLIAEKLLGHGIGAAAVAIDPAQIKGVLPLPLSQLRAGLPALGNPANLHRAVSLTESQFRFGFGNALTEQESRELFERWTIPSPARPLFQAAAANFVMHSQAAVDTAREDRGPLLLISGTADHTVPDVVTRSTFKQYRDSAAVTELKQFEGRGHSLTIDHGWQEVADVILGWLRDKGL